MLALFNIYVLQINFSETPEETTKLTDILQLSYSIILLIVLGYFLYVEAVQFIKTPKEYFTSFWNITDLCSYSLCIMVVIFDRASV